jgi:hypothetical protein
MRVRTVSVLFIIMAMYMIFAVATEVFVDEFVKPQTFFSYLLLSTLITGIASLTINIDIPE